MGSLDLDFCDKASWFETCVAMAITYCPVLIYSLKVSRGNLFALLNFCILVLATFTLAYLLYSRGTVKPITISLGAVVCFLWGFRTLQVLGQYCLSRCRLLRLGRSYIFAPASHLSTESGLLPVQSASTAYVVRSPGQTTVNGQVVPKFRALVLNGLKAGKRGAVTLTRYGRK
nr:M protein [Lopma virus]